MSYPAPDSKIHVVVTEWNSKWILAIDGNTNQYIHWLEDDKRWEGQWSHLVGKPELMLLARVGRSDGPRGRKFFVLQADVTIAEPKEPAVPFDASNDVPRSPLDVVTAVGSKPRKGDCSFTVSLPSEEDRILVNRLCEKAQEAKLVKYKGHYPGQYFKAWLLEQAVKDGLLQL